MQVFVLDIAFGLVLGLKLNRNVIQYCDVCASVRACLRACVCMCVCVCACIRACVRACLCVRASRTLTNATVNKEVLFTVENPHLRSGHVKAT